MGFVSRFALLFVLLGAPALAQEIKVGTTLICDTQQQVERFVSVYRGDAESAANTVNTEVSNPTACDMVPIVYMTGPEVATARTDNRAFRIIKVIVLGVVTGNGVVAAEPSVYFSYDQIDESAA